MVIKKIDRSARASENQDVDNYLNLNFLCFRAYNVSNIVLKNVLCRD